VSTTEPAGAADRTSPQREPLAEHAGIAGLDGLRFGVATSAYQVEGATDADGRGVSIWDTFAHRPGAIADSSDGSVACASYERWDDDLALLGELGVATYRFSVAWPRVQPTGSGPPAHAGLAYYDRMVDDLLAAGIEPLVTLYHWDLPQAVEDAGGWPARATTGRFADYTAAVAARLADRVRVWATVNEPWCTAFHGYASGHHAPGRREPAAAYAAAHHLLVAHALGAQAVHAINPSAEVGIVLNLVPVRLQDPGGAAAAQMIDAIQNRLWLDALLRGDYPQELAEWLADPGLIRPGDLELIAGSADWLGVNYYTPYRGGAAGAPPVPRPTHDMSASEYSGPPAAGTSPYSPHSPYSPYSPYSITEPYDDVDDDLSAYPGAPPATFHRLAPRSTMGWEVDPAGLEEVLARLRVLAPRLPLRVTENGMACPDTARTPDGLVDDQDRIAYLHSHLAALGRARRAGSNVRDYLVWTLLDNFEWAYGYQQRFGLAEVVAGTLTRRPKRSFQWYAALARGARAR
jgi:beta-glucosidase